MLNKFMFLLCIIATAPLSAMEIKISTVPTEEKKLVEVQLPSAEILRELLQQQGLEHFVERTNICDDLGACKKKISVIVTTLQKAIRTYGVSIKDQPFDMVKIMQSKSDAIMKSILKDSPEALEEYEDSWKYLFKPKN